VLSLFDSEQYSYDSFDALFAYTNIHHNYIIYLHCSSNLLNELQTLLPTLLASNCNQRVLPDSLRTLYCNDNQFNHFIIPLFVFLQYFIIIFINPLTSALGNVHKLNLQYTKVVDVSALRDVHILYLSYTNVADVSALRNVHTINLKYTKVVDVSALENVKRLIR
jgi:hypothetical protein